MPDADARVTAALDAAVVRSWARLAAGALGRERDAIDHVNVFPVADGDTGTNMHLTAREGARSVAAAPDDAGAAALLRRLARGALLGARGNSGVILSEWLRGLAVAATRGDTLARALDVAAGTARTAVAHPEPGTILTAADVAAAAAHDVAARPGARADDVLEAAVRGAREAALSSVDTLAPLARAGVLDAGACGLVLVLDALRVARRFATAPGPEPAERAGVSVATTSMLAVMPVTLGLEMTGHDTAHADAVEPGPWTPPGGHQGVPWGADELEVMFVLRRPAGADEFPDGGVADTLRADLATVGGSVVVVGGADLGSDEDSAWQAHVHTPDLGAALAVARRWAGRGRVEPVHVRHLAVPDAGLVVVASTDAPALAAELARAGAVVLVPVAPVGVHARDLALAAVGAGPRTVLVLRNGGQAVEPAVRRLAAEHEAEDGAPPGVVVLDTPTDVHAAVVVAVLAAAADDPQADVAQAVRDALGGLRAAATDADDAEDALRALLDGGGEVVTLLADDLVRPELVAELADVADERGAECVLLRTGRAGTGVAIGVEG
ncbi:Dak phosphatase [Xylanimonas cellulosilytica DSM 15894]|uniref:Dak phosphatase n=1 Tax=Xylanimonas cellulosilytica (strain DSM 15894 / JCM 12276 / CECT 5975 / KCTC 9989 / LMG 20990 / NBRC 107835 / XIL07) TaxID=446471 RepID=D1BV59_XYLCX|nr:DAK2 domain-containing protein [Xylanimonas cellulosilytica]ACZ31298.1 Dak phosphatase [Xylanimonas cellulosilytica DSM 15894]